MKFVFFIGLFLSGCFFGPVQELHDQIEETYFGNDFVDTPTPLVELKSSIRVDIKEVWSENIGEHNGKNLDLFYIDDFIYVAASDGAIKKIDSKSGNKSWEKNIDLTITSGISGSSESLIFSTADGFLWCMNHEGELIWKTLLEGEINSLPLVYNGKIVVKLNSYKIIQLNEKDGSIIWKYQAAIPPLTFKSEGKLVQSNKVVYLGLPGGKLIAIDSPTGGLVWESNISRSRGTTDIERANDITSHPIIDGPIIYGVTTNGDISALDRRNGKTIWTKPLSSFYGMTFDGFNLFVSHDTGSIYSLNKDDGEIKWRQAALKYRRIRTGTMIGDYIIYGDYFGYVHLLDVNDGDIIGRLKLEDSQILNNIIKIDDSLVTLMTAEGDLICLKIGDKKVNKLPDVIDEVEKKKTGIKKHRLFDKSDDRIENDVEGKKSNLKKHRVFDDDKKGFLDRLFGKEEKEKEKGNKIDNNKDDDIEEKKSNLKKHRVFDDDKKDEEKGILDKLFD